MFKNQMSELAKQFERETSIKINKVLNQESQLNKQIQSMKTAIGRSKGNKLQNKIYTTVLGSDIKLMKYRLDKIEPMKKMAERNIGPRLDAWMSRVYNTRNIHEKFYSLNISDFSNVTNENWKHVKDLFNFNVDKALNNSPFEDYNSFKYTILQGLLTKGYDVNGIIGLFDNYSVRKMWYLWKGDDIHTRYEEFMDNPADWIEKNIQTTKTSERNAAMKSLGVTQEDLDLLEKIRGGSGSEFI